MLCFYPECEQGRVRLANNKDGISKEDLHATRYAAGERKVDIAYTMHRSAGLDAEMKRASNVVDEHVIRESIAKAQDATLYSAIAGMPIPESKPYARRIEYDWAYVPCTAPGCVDGYVRGKRALSGKSSKRGHRRCSECGGPPGTIQVRVSK